MAAAELQSPQEVVDELPFEDDVKDYIVDRLDPVLEEMVANTITAMPDDPFDHMIEWLRKRCGAPSSPRRSLQMRNAMLKQELRKVTETLEEAGTVIPGTPSEQEDEDEEEDSDESCDELPESFRKSEVALSRARQSVSAESYGLWNQKKAFEAPVYTKTAEQMERLRNTLMQSFMFNCLEDKDWNTILLAMKEALFSAGSQVIVEGQDGENLFVIERGFFECTKKIDGEEQVVKTCSPGDVFGELALLYNCPRAATVTAKENCVCWQLDRMTFNHVVKDAAIKRREKYDTFLKSVTLLASLGAIERAQIADVLKSETFLKGHVVVKQDDPGDRFYMVEEGSLYATKVKSDAGEQRVMDYGPGDYFGELSLLNNKPRAASVIVSSDKAKVLSMSRTAFSTMLGPLQGILARQVASYR
eukprot:TRINITY_DN12191_c0_g1_i1.p1 TRINITY_DN12191_c0_g1~~TRINITY_DN12191_c0_g1_i1.p1  ORF type:complete len:417 (+),score=119.97 TRINITY_DN12191_c0_g1_i1:158-1408(+)